MIIYERTVPDLDSVWKYGHGYALRTHLLRSASTQPAPPGTRKQLPLPGRTVEPISDGATRPQRATERAVWTGGPMMAGVTATAFLMAFCVVWVIIGRSIRTTNRLAVEIVMALLFMAAVLVSWFIGTGGF
jgi:hypothetical protein